MHQFLICLRFAAFAFLFFSNEIKVIAGETDRPLIRSLKRAVSDLQLSNRSPEAFGKFEENFKRIAQEMKLIDRIAAVEDIVPNRQPEALFLLIAARPSCFRFSGVRNFHQSTAAADDRVDGVVAMRFAADLSFREMLLQAVCWSGCMFQPQSTDVLSTINFIGFNFEPLKRGFAHTRFLHAMLLAELLGMNDWSRSEAIFNWASTGDDEFIGSIQAYIREHEIAADGWRYRDSGKGMVFNESEFCLSAVARPKWPTGSIDTLTEEFFGDGGFGRFLFGYKPADVARLEIPLQTTASFTWEAAFEKRILGGELHLNDVVAIIQNGKSDPDELSRVSECMGFVQRATNQASIQEWIRCFQIIEHADIGLHKWGNQHPDIAICKASSHFRTLLLWRLASDSQFRCEFVNFVLWRGVWDLSTPDAGPSLVNSVVIPRIEEIMRLQLAVFCELIGVSSANWAIDDTNTGQWMESVFEQAIECNAVRHGFRFQLEETSSKGEQRASFGKVANWFQSLPILPPPKSPFEHAPKDLELFLEGQR